MKLCHNTATASLDC